MTISDNMSELLTLFRYLLCLLLLLQAGAAEHLERHEGYPPSRLEARSPSDSLNIVRGLLSSNKILQFISSIPCDVIQTLENDADEASNFLSQLESGQVPTLIEDLPQEAFDAFQSIIGIFETLPSELIGAAEAAVTDAAQIFNDIGTGAIIDDIEQIPGAVVSLVTEEWGDFTSALVNDWDAATDAIACFFGDCPASTVGSGGCLNSAVATTTDSATVMVQPVQPTFVMPVSTVNVIVPATPVQTLTDELSAVSTVPYDDYTTAPYDFYTTAPYDSYTTAPYDSYITAPSDSYTSTAVNTPVSAISTGASYVGISARLLPPSFMLEGISKMDRFAATEWASFGLGLRSKIYTAIVVVWVGINSRVSV
ncbi:hypothetical protein G7Y79_00014g037120 [Physcia stellaris]|nr:hypothetical protein G7Y79_00014g037120 [Physcia stellaris]